MANSFSFFYSLLSNLKPNTASIKNEMLQTIAMMCAAETPVPKVPLSANIKCSHVLRNWILKFIGWFLGCMKIIFMIFGVQRQMTWGLPKVCRKCAETYFRHTFRQGTFRQGTFRRTFRHTFRQSTLEFRQPFGNLSASIFNFR